MDVIEGNGSEIVFGNKINGRLGQGVDDSGDAVCEFVDEFNGLHLK